MSDVIESITPDESDNDELNQLSGSESVDESLILPEIRMGLPSFDELTEGEPFESVSASSLTESVHGDALELDSEDDDIEGETPNYLERTFGDENRIEIRNVSRPPYNMICCLEIRHRAGNFLGTGWLASPRLIVTAGHNVYDSRHGGWAQTIVVTPGRSASSTLGRQEVTRHRFRATRQYIRNGSFEYDYGAIFLPRSFDRSKVGFFGVKNFTADRLRGLTVNIAGYPSGTGKRLFAHAGPIRRVTPRLVRYLIDTSPGQSGSPLIFGKKNSAGRIVDYLVCGIHNSNLGSANGAARINNSVFSLIKQWREEAES